MSKVLFQNISLYYRQKQNPITLVLIHGFCEDSTVWDSIIPEIVGVNDLIVDLPGFGKSETLESLSMDTMADAVKFVLDKNGVDKCIMIGHSMGGYVTLNFAKRFSDYLLGIGLFNSHPFADTEEGRMNRKRGIEFVKKNGAKHYVSQVIPGLFPEPFRSENEALIKGLVEDASEYDPVGIIAALAAMLDRPDHSKTIEELNIPVLHILGKAETVIPHEINLKQCHLANVAQIHILENVGHMAMYEAKEKSIGILNEFINFCVNYRNQQ